MKDDARSDNGTQRRVQHAMNAHRNRPAGRRRFAALALATLLAGCAALQPPRVEVPTLYILAAEPLPRATGPHHDAVVEIASPRAWPGFGTEQMAYVRHPYEVDYYAASRWADTPARMLQPLLARALEQTGSFRSVIRAPGLVPADVRLDTELVRLQQDFTVQPSRVEFTLRAQLVDVRERRVIATKVFDQVENAPREDAEGGVVAANVALQRLLGEVADFCIAEAPRR